MKRKISTVFVVILLLIPFRAKADLFGGDIVVLTQILAQAIQQLVQLKQILQEGQDSLQPGQKAITTFNRNWTNRMGVGGEGYLASPSVVAASALLGYMAPPSELGLTWEPEAFAV